MPPCSLACPLRGQSERGILRFRSKLFIGVWSNAHFLPNILIILALNLVLDSEKAESLRSKSIKSPNPNRSMGFVNFSLSFNSFAKDIITMEESSSNSGSFSKEHAQISKSYRCDVNSILLPVLTSAIALSRRRPRVYLCQNF